MLRRLLQLGALQRVQPHAANAYANFSSLSAATASAWAPPSAAQRPAAALAASALLGVAGRRAAFPAAAAGAASQLTSLLRFASNKTRSAGLKAYKPNTPGFRGRVITSREGLWKGRPHRDLTVGLRKKGGRNRGGSITVRHRGGGAKRLYRIIDFKRTARPAPGTVERVEYDPNRSARIALLRFEQPGGMDKPEYKYVLAPRGVAQGDVLHSGAGSPIKAGNTLPLSAIPIGEA